MEPAREGDIRHSRADAGRARWVLGWEARTTLSAGLADTWEWSVGAHEDGGGAAHEDEDGGAQEDNDAGAREDADV
jgi:hypothetical protein